MLINYKKGDRIVPSKYFLEDSARCTNIGISASVGEELLNAYRRDIPIYVYYCDNATNGLTIRIICAGMEDFSEYWWPDEYFDFYDFTNDTIKEISELSLSKAIDLI